MGIRLWVWWIVQTQLARQWTSSCVPSSHIPMVCSIHHTHNLIPIFHILPSSHSEHQHQHRHQDWDQRQLLHRQLTSSFFPSIHIPMVYSIHHIHIPSHIHIPNHDHSNHTKHQHQVQLLFLHHQLTSSYVPNTHIPMVYSIHHIHHILPIPILHILPSSHNERRHRHQDWVLRPLFPLVE